ncbi:MAG: transcriptional repressor [Planctomycetota bacterium]|nr:transcriptional repressor [Planctomycetota bacterium]MDA1105093.1 transcriptional repressor [Planctomycetota bacterium]
MSFVRRPLAVPPHGPAGRRSQHAMPMAPLCSVFRRFLKSQGLKYTSERAEILEAIIRRDGLFEAEELLLELRSAGHQVSKATVYRTINLLIQAGLIVQALFDSKQSHYQLIYGKEPRDHMVCMRTGRLVEFESEQLTVLRDRICSDLGWEPVAHRFQIYALSPEGKAAIEGDETARDSGGEDTDGE